MKLGRGRARVPALESGPRQEGEVASGRVCFSLAHDRTLREPANLSSAVATVRSHGGHVQNGPT
jgi:hypothetical protein